MDSNSGLIALGTAIGSAKIIEKVLGPTADYVGKGIQEFTEKRVANIKRIFEWAAHFLGDKPDHNGASPRVLRDVLEDGSYRDDSLTACYYGGILASSRSGIPRDDRAASYSSLVSRLTTYQLRAHFIFYRSARQLYLGEHFDGFWPLSRKAYDTRIPIRSYLEAMQPEEGENHDSILTHVLFGLYKEALIGANFSGTGDPELYIDRTPHWRSEFSRLPGGAGWKYTMLDLIRILPSVSGAELFLWATGNSQVSIDKLFDPELRLPSIDIPDCIAEKPREQSEPLPGQSRKPRRQSKKTRRQ
jgi:hypothetical protein